MRKLFIIKKLHINGFGKKELIHAYTTFIRPHLEYCSVSWGSNLSDKLKIKVEKCQKRALSMILKLKVDRKNYCQILDDLNLETLEKRREKSLMRFGRGMFISKRYRRMLPAGASTHFRTLRRRQALLVEPVTKRDRYKFSTIPQITRAINTEYIEKGTIFGWSKTEADVVEGRY